MLYILISIWVYILNYVEQINEFLYCLYFTIYAFMLIIQNGLDGHLFIIKTAISYAYYILK